MRLTAVCLNPCIDKMVRIAAFRYGGMNRIENSRSDASGKGVNVGIVAKRLGLDATVTGFLFKKNGNLVMDRLQAENVAGDFVLSEGEVRTNLKVFDEEKAIVTEINERGVSSTEAMLVSMQETVARLSPQSEMMVFTGSLPPNTPENFYETLLHCASGSLNVLDAEGEPFLQGLRAKPYMIKPNSYELALAVNRPIDTLEDVIHGAEELQNKGIQIVCVSMGADGAYITQGKERYFAPPLTIRVESTVGAGDSMVAGICASLMKGSSLKESFQSGVACAGAALCASGTQLCTIEKYKELFPMVQIETL